MSILARHVLPFRNTSDQAVPELKAGYARISGSINIERTLEDKMNKKFTRVVYITIAPKMDIRIYPDKNTGEFQFGESHVDIPYWLGKKLGIIGDYMTILTKEGSFSKRQQKDMSRPVVKQPHNYNLNCLCDYCIVPF